MCLFVFVCFFKQKTAYEMRISDWSSDVCSSDLTRTIIRHVILNGHACPANSRWWRPAMTKSATPAAIRSHFSDVCERLGSYQTNNQTMEPIAAFVARRIEGAYRRSEEHTSELQSLMRISYAHFCLTNKLQLGTHCNK